MSTRPPSPAPHPQGDMESDRPAPDFALTRQSFLWVLLFGCGLSLVPLWLLPFPPMVDLPQHAAQIATWHRWDSSDFDYSRHLFVNWRTPYLVANTLAFVFSWWVPVSTAFKLVLSLAILGIPLVTWVLLGETRGNPWWTLLVLPVGYSYAFFMGFVAFSLATPLALLFVLYAWRYARDPTRSRGWLLLLLLQLLFLTHTLLYGWSGLIGALLVAAYAPGVGATLHRWWPYFAATVLPGAWVLLTLGGESTVQGAAIGAYPWNRLLEIPSFVLGQPPSSGAFAVGSLFLLLPFLAHARGSRDLPRWIPLIVTLVLFLACPHRLFGTSFLYRRFGVLVLPCLLFALDWRPGGVAVRWRRALCMGLVALWLGFLGIRTWGHGGEIGAFHSIIDVIEPNRRVLYMAIEPRSEFIPYPVFLHYGCWYQVEHGGLVDFSFASFFPNRFRYRDDHRPALPHEFEWRPWEFDWQLHGGETYDYVLVRSFVDPRPLLRRSGARVQPTARGAGGWWLFTKEKAPESEPLKPAVPPIEANSTWNWTPIKAAS